MKNPILITIATLMFFTVALQVFMFYQIHEKIDQYFAVEKNLNQTVSQGENIPDQDSGNWNPNQELLQMKNQVNQMINDFISRFQRNAPADPLTQLLAITLQDANDHYVVTVDVPDADDSALDVTLNERQLTVSIKIENNKELPVSGSQNPYNEKFSGHFQRSIELPDDVDKKRMTTEYDNWALTINLPKMLTGS